MQNSLFDEALKVVACDTECIVVRDEDGDACYNLFKLQ